MTFPVTVKKNSIIDSGSNKNGRNGPIPIDMGGLPHQNGRHTISLLDLAANLRYFGECSLVALLLECRFIFAKVIGITKLADDPLKEQVIDEPNR